MKREYRPKSLRIAVPHRYAEGKTSLHRVVSGLRMIFQNSALGADPNRKT